MQVGDLVSLDFRLHIVIFQFDLVVNLLVESTQSDALRLIVL